MVSSVFSDQSITHLIEIFFWMFGAFLIGLFFGRVITKRKSETMNDVNEFEDLNIKDDTTKIRAVKTFERGGKEMVQTITGKKAIEPLDFNRIGKATPDKKDNLQEINGIGVTTEEKLNAIGIVSYKQISNLNSSDITTITELIKFFPNRIERDDWVGQAYKLMNNE